MALEHLAEHTQRLTGMACACRCDPKLRVRDPMVAINLFRIAQEAVHNAVKYSRAKHLHIDFSSEDGKHRLTIRDDGIGFAPERIDTGHGLGLHSLRYRAALLGGAFEMNKNSQGGTTVAVIYPNDRGGQAGAGE